MSSKIKYAVIPADPTQPIQFKEAAPTLDLWQEEVGGYIEPIHIRPNAMTEPVPVTTSMEFFANEEGKLDQLPHNHRASLLAWKSLRQGDYISGNVVVYGDSDRDGECLGLTDEQVGILKALDEARGHTH